MAHDSKQTPPYPNNAGTTAAQPEKRVSIDEALAIASRQIDAGNLEPAEGVLRQILGAQPSNPFALHLLGLVALRAGKPDMAVELIGKAIAILPTEAHFHRNLGEIHRTRKQLDLAVKHGRHAVSLAPEDAIAHSNLGIALYDLKQYDEARACQQQALKLQPGLAQALNNLGSISRDTKNREAALDYYRQTLDAAPGYLEARNNLAAVLTELDRAEEALSELQEVLRHRPNYADAHCNVGNAFLRMENHEKAHAAFAQARNLSPDLPAATIGLARVAKETEQNAQATVLAERAIEMQPEKAEGYALLGDIHVQGERYDLAQKAYEQALTIEPDSVRAHMGMGHMWLELGKLDRARAAFEQATALDPSEISPHISMAHARKVSPDDPLLQRLEKEAEQIDTLPKTRAIALHFALGKAYDDIRAHDKAFPHFHEGGRLKRDKADYDADHHDRVCEKIRDTFSKEAIEEWRGAGDPSDVPIFVLGMPRSGTTLVETILASHPDVHGAGECHDLMNIANNPLREDQPSGFPNSMQGIGHDELTRMGGRYLESLRQRAPTARRITDKMPANFLALGLIPLILPNARIVHVRRNPADVCLSNFTKLFNRGQYHSYDLTELGRFYVAYARLMEHWRAVLPENTFLDLQYEDLVADREKQTRRLIDFCGLTWDDACLSHHKTERSVKTASVTQVRQPVYKSSVERWRHYEPFLEPLMQALGPYAPTLD